MLRVCLDCTAAYAPDIRHCPHCGSERSEMQGSDPYRAGGDDSVPKISRLGGATFRGEHGPELVDMPEAPDEGEPSKDEGGEQPSPGSSSKTSSAKPSTKHEPNEKHHQQPARTTGSRSKKGRTGGSTARSTDGDQTDGGSAAE